VSESTTEHPSITSFRAALERESHGEHALVVLPDAVHTAALAAEALGCEVGAIANSLVFDADNEPILILTSGGHRVDVKRTAERIGVPALRRASGVSPIDHPEPLRTYLDVTLRGFDAIWAAAGHPAAVFRTTYDELLAMTGAEEIEVE
jgi:prolyl-tRNA editing enzyme YbaK/EbsC (Cys-tRNA(Pro) deacylase)